MNTIGSDVNNNWSEFEEKVKFALKNINLTPAFVKNIILKLSEHDETVEFVLDAKGKKQLNSNLRDSEKIPLKDDIDEYFEREVKPYYSNAWMDRKKDKIGYEINFTRYFYKYVPPRPLDEIEADIRNVIGEIKELIEEDFEG